MIVGVCFLINFLVCVAGFVIFIIVSTIKKLNCCSRLSENGGLKKQTSFDESTQQLLPFYRVSIKFDVIYSRIFHSVSENACNEHKMCLHVFQTIFAFSTC